MKREGSSPLIGNISWQKTWSLGKNDDYTLRKPFPEFWIIPLAYAIALMWAVQIPLRHIHLATIDKKVEDAKGC